MSLLLDTHVLIWASEIPERLGKLTRALLLDERQPIFVSAISTLEVARLASLRQLVLTTSVTAWCERARSALGASALPVDDPVAVEAYSLPGAFHSDPADRILVASARLHGLRLVTADRRILAYRPVQTQNARK